MKKYWIPVGIVIVLTIAGFSFFNSEQSINTLAPEPSINPQASSTPEPPTSTLNGVFEGITPCDGTKPPLPQIPANTECEMTIWHITFNPDFTYTLISSYGMTQPGSPGIRGGGTQITMQGEWTEDPHTNIIQLTANNPQESVSFIAISDQLIHLLDDSKEMMIGNGGWSYTLNKTQ